MKRFLRRISDFGVSHAESKSEKRNIILTNYVSMIVATAPLLLIVAIVSTSFFDTGMIVRLLGSSILFLLPLFLNRLGFVRVSRIVMCWLTPCFVFGLSIMDLKAGIEMSVASFVGLRLFFLAGCCFPFLVFNLKNRLLIVGLSVPFLSLLFMDSVFNLFDVGYFGLDDPFYKFNNIRALVSVLAIGFSLYFLKIVVERNEQLNQHLLEQLEEKNKLIQQQAADKVHELNKQLTRNLQELSEREFILKQSQRIAKIGSWEYGIMNSFTFWSEEMYNIFGLSHDFDLKSKDLSRIMWGEESKLLMHATIHALRSGEPFDITVRARNPIGYLKWVRIYAFPRILEGRTVGLRGICHDITYYKEAEELLRASENRYRSLFEQASDFIAILDFEGNFLEANASWCSAFGYSKTELGKMKIEALIEPEQLSEKPIMYAELQRGDHVFSYRRMMHKDKTIVEVEANVKKMQEGQMLVIARDVTKLREVQRQIQVSEAKFRGAFEHSAIGMALGSLDGKWMKVNKDLCDTFGYSEEELLQRTIDEMTHPDDLEIDHELEEKIRSGAIELFQREKRYIHKNGSLVWCNVNVSLIRDSLGAPMYFVGQIEDITEDKAAAEKLILNEANLNATINNTELLIWSVDRNLNLLMFNIQFAKYIERNYGVTIQTGTRVFSSLPTAQGFEMTTKWTSLYLRALAGERIILEESRFGIDFQYSLSPIIKDEQVIGVSVFADNVTHRKARDRELVEANKKIGELKLMALRSVMSPHFIFNVLNSIQFFIARNDRLNAINYLSTFSKLVRSILTHSVDNKIKLSEEIDMLTNYVQLEMTRFEDKFDFNLVIDEGLEVDSIVIPSLLIQPYVENAILHGLYNKQIKGELTIRVGERDGTVFFEIEDNGIGRAAAMELRKKNFPSHQSMGISITEERLKLINADHNTAFEIEDLMNNDGPCGTRVKIGIRV